MKRCSLCGEDKDASLFYYYKTTGRHSARCKECIKGKQLAYAANNREKEKARKRRWYYSNRDQAISYSSKWNKTNQERRREIAASAENRRRARKRDNGFEPYDRLSVYDRDGGMCHICRHPIDMRIAWPDLMCFSVDHIIPISLGGPDTMDNVAAAHLFCNIKRGNR